MLHAGLVKGVDSPVPQNCLPQSWVVSPRIQVNVL
jgi:hypothetical protein